MKLNLLIIGAAIIMICVCTLASCDAISTSVASDPKQIHSTDRAQVLNSDTLNNPVLVITGADGSIRLNAINGKAIGPDIKYMPEWKAFGWFTAADRVEWEVEVKKTGSYKVFLEWSVADEEAGKEFLLETRNEKLTGIISGSGSWETYKTAGIGTITLEAGRQLMMFRANKHFDKGALLDFRELKMVVID